MRASSPAPPRVLDLVPTLSLTAKACGPAASGHPWFTADDLRNPDTGLHGRLVRVLTDRGDDLGLGFYSARSRLSLRLCGSWPGETVPDVETFFAARLAAACAVRARLDGLGGEPRGVRLVHGDSDGLPGLVVDRYDRCLVLQSTTEVVERNLSCIVPWLRDEVGAVSVLARNDLPARSRIGLPEEIRLLEGKRIEEVEIEEHTIRHRVRPFTGEQTGFYLDQGPARGRVLALAARRRVLDLCCYQGGFALAALRGGAVDAVAVDRSEVALASARRAAEDNGLGPLRTECASVLDSLRERCARGDTYDLVSLDPPASVETGRGQQGALRGGRDLNRLALRVLAPGGYLLTCSRSRAESLPGFEAVLGQAAVGLPFPVILVERLMAGPDHPAWLALPEAETLKVVLLRRSGHDPRHPGDLDQR